MGQQQHKHTRTYYLPSLWQCQEVDKDKDWRDDGGSCQIIRILCIADSDIYHSNYLPPAAAEDYIIWSTCRYPLIVAFVMMLNLVNITIISSI